MSLHGAPSVYSNDTPPMLYCRWLFPTPAFQNWDRSCALNWHTPATVGLLHFQSLIIFYNWLISVVPITVITLKCILIFPFHHCLGVRLENFTAMKVCVMVIWIVTTCTDTVGYQHFGEWRQRCRQYGPPKCWYPTSLHSIITQKTTKGTTFIFLNTVLRRMFGHKREKVAQGLRRMHNEELQNLYTSRNIIRVIKSRIIIWVGLYSTWTG